MDKISGRLAEYIKLKREEMNITQEELAELSAIDYKQIQNLESFKRINNPRLSTLLKLSKAFNVKVEDIIAYILKKK